MAWHSPQCLKALKAYFPTDRWRATEVIEPDGTVRFLLKDGVEVHRVGQVYDYDIRKLVGRARPRGRYVALSNSIAELNVNRT